MLPEIKLFDVSALADRPEFPAMRDGSYTAATTDVLARTWRHTGRM
jgi:hypothetical protein